MKLNLLFSILFLTKLAFTDQENSCDQYSKLIYYGALVCSIDYEHCPSDNSLEIDSCIGYRCRFEINGRCYYYSYQVYDKGRCMSECCGYPIPAGSVVNTQQISQCLSVNLYQNTPPPEGPFNKLPVVLGSLLGVVFLIILTMCICCRQRIKAIFESNDPSVDNRPSRKAIRQSNYEMDSNNIHFILEKSEQNIVYDEQIQCTICLSSSNEIQTSCGHWFHLKCLGQWCEKNLKCPNCMSEQFNPVRVLCIQCHKPFVQLRLNRKNRLGSLKKQMGEICKSCNQLKS